MQMILNTKVSLWIRNKTESLVGILYVSCTRSTLIDVSSQVTPSIPPGVSCYYYEYSQMQKLLLDFILL